MMVQSSLMWASQREAEIHFITHPDPTVALLPLDSSSRSGSAGDCCGACCGEGGPTKAGHPKNKHTFAMTGQHFYLSIARNFHNKFLTRSKKL